MSPPNKYPAPLGLRPQPSISICINLYHQDLTTLNRTLLHHEEPQLFYLLPLSIILLKMTSSKVKIDGDKPP